MGKTLITKNNLKDYLDAGGASITLTPERILTPGAKDLVREMNVKICFADGLEAAPEEKRTGATPLQSTALSDRVCKILHEEHGIDDQKLVRKIVDRIQKQR